MYKDWLRLVGLNTFGLPLVRYSIYCGTYLRHECLDIGHLKVLRKKQLFAMWLRSQRNVGANTHLVCVQGSGVCENSCS